MRVDVKIDEPVKLEKLNGTYLLHSKDSAKVLPDKGAFLVNWQIIDGEDLEDGSSPIGRVVTHFLRYDPAKATEKERDGVKPRFDKFVAYSGIEHDDEGLESEDFVDVEVRAKVKFYNEVDGMDNYNITYLPPAVPF